MASVDRKLDRLPRNPLADAGCTRPQPQVSGGSRSLRLQTWPKSSDNTTIGQIIDFKIAKIRLMCDRGLASTTSLIARMNSFLRVGNRWR